MGDVTRFVVSTYEESQGETEAAASARATLEKLLALFEEAMVSGDREVEELVAVSFVENLNAAGEHYAEIRKLLGKRLLRQLKQYEREHGWPQSL
jgi:hypothetical protein